MVVVTDITGNVNDIHPRNKRDVGARLARWALAKDYDRSDLVYSGPMYNSKTAAGNQIVLSFEHVGGGLKSLDGKALTAFTIAGADKQFVPAQAVVKGDTVVVSAAEVKAPAAVRYAWQGTTIGNLGNAEELPASPFRTDDW